MNSNENSYSNKTEKLLEKHIFKTPYFSSRSNSYFASFGNALLFSGQTFYTLSETTIFENKKKIVSNRWMYYELFEMYYQNQKAKEELMNFTLLNHDHKKFVEILHSHIPKVYLVLGVMKQVRENFNQIKKNNENDYSYFTYNIAEIFGVEPQPVIFDENHYLQIQNLLSPKEFFNSVVPQHNLSPVTTTLDETEYNNLQLSSDCSLQQLYDCEEFLAELND